MRRAIVIAARYPGAARYPNDPAWALDAELLAARLAQHGYRPVRVAPGQGLDGLREQLRTAVHEDPTLLYFAGYLLLSTTGEPAVLFGGEHTQTLGVRALLQRVAAQLDHALVVLDVRAGSEVESALEMSEAVILERTLAAANDANVDLVVRLQPWGSASDANTVALYDVLGSLAQAPSAATTVELAEAFARADTGTAIRYRVAAEPFVVLPERPFAGNGAALVAAPTISLASGPRTAQVSEPEERESVPRISVPPPKPGRTVIVNPPPASAEELQTDAHGGEPSRLSGRPPPKPASATASLPPAKPASALASLPPPKPTGRAPSLAPPKPTVLVTPLPLPVELEPVRPMPIQPVVAPPPQQPELQPPPPSWSSAPPPELPVTVPEDEPGLARALEASTDEQLDDRVALCEAFLERHPQSKLALHRLSEELSRTEQWERLGAAYERLLSQQVAPEAVVQLCLAQARLACNQLQTPERARPAIERATQLEPGNAELQLEAAAIYERLDDLGSARAHYLAALRAAPLDVDTHRRLHAFWTFVRDADRAWQAAATLHGLGAATKAERSQYERQSPGALPKPARPLVAEDWMLGLEPGAKDPALTTLLELVSDAAIACFKPDKQELARLRERVELEDVAGSTTMLARSLSWTTQFLGLPRPALYLDVGDAGPAPLPIADLAWLVGREFGRGTHQANLVFHWARSLGSNTGTARVLRLYPNAERLSELLSACLLAVKREPLGKSPEVLDLALALRQKLDSASLRSLLQLLARASAEEWQRRVIAFVEQVERCGNRTGLLACGDPAIAIEALGSSGPSAASTHPALGDLLVFAASDELAELRRRLGISRGS